MKVDIKETYPGEPKIIEFSLEVESIALAIKASSKLLRENPLLEMVEIFCLDPLEHITLTR